MTEIVHARLDKETARLLERLRRQLGQTDSELVRRGLRALADRQIPARRREVIGQGAFESGVNDLGSDERHLDGFGK